MMNINIRLIDTPEAVIREAIVASLIEYNTARSGINDHRLLALAVEGGDGKPLGGLWGRTGFGWLFVELLLVPEALRGQGVGTSLMMRAEQEALRRGCHHVWLDTFEFQARGFYERLGYSCFGELQDYPVGVARYFMKKTLKE